MIATARAHSADGFAATWFIEEFAGTIYTAAALFPRTHPDLRAVGIVWSLENPLEVPLIVNDAISNPHRFRPSDDERRVILSGLVPIGDLVDATDELVRVQKERFRRTVLTRYGVPASLW